MVAARFPLAILLSLALSSCVSFPQSKEEFRAAEAGVLEFTIDESLTDSYATIASNTVRCHRGDFSQMSTIGSSFVVFPAGRTRVEGTTDSQGAHATITVEYLSPTVSGLLQVIDLEAITPASTRIIVHRLNDTKKWRTATEAVQRWFEGSEACYELM